MSHTTVNAMFFKPLATVLLVVALIGAFDEFGFDTPVVLSCLELGIAFLFMAIGGKYIKHKDRIAYFFQVACSICLVLFAFAELMRSIQFGSTLLPALLIVFATLLNFLTSEQRGE